MAGGSIRIEKIVDGDLVVSITRVDDSAVTIYSDAALQSSVTMPATITSSTTYYVGENADYEISVKLNGVEIANTPDAVKVAGIRNGQHLHIAPFPDPSDQVFAPGEWQSYTPTVGGTGWAKGDGTVAGYFCKFGTLVFFKASFTLGASSTAGSANPTITLPKTATNSLDIASPLTAMLYDAGGTYYSAVAQITSTTVCTIKSTGTADVVGLVDTTTPFTWATGDIIYVSGFYEAA